MRVQPNGGHERNEIKKPYGTPHCWQKNEVHCSCILGWKKTVHVWEALLLKWVATSIGYPDTVQLDQGKQFWCGEFAVLLLTTGISRKDAGVKSQNSLGEVERYHAYLRHIYEKVRVEHPNMPIGILFQLAVKGSNDTAGPSGLLPALLAIDVMPQFPLHPLELSVQKERIDVLNGGWSVT